jgi:hypothetical protein
MPRIARRTRTTGVIQRCTIRSGEAGDKARSRIISPQTPNAVQLQDCEVGEG